MTLGQSLSSLTADWGSNQAVNLYLDRCQVDTPKHVIQLVWKEVQRRRKHVGKVIDFGAGDGRFATMGQYDRYVGYEIDPGRWPSLTLPAAAELVPQCAFAEHITDADLCIGNPPYVRNQDLPEGWQQKATASLKKRTGLRLSGLANAWQYFFLLSLCSSRPDGLVAIVIPYEWVSRPSARALREYIREQGWAVNVYRLRDQTFARVLTTSSITIVDKRRSAASWKFFDENPRGGFNMLKSETGSRSGVIRYCKRSAARRGGFYAKRGLSPGTQEVLTLTEGERARSGLKVNVDVVSCVTSLRFLDESCSKLTQNVFKNSFRDAGLKCWLIRTDQPPSNALKSYLESVPQMRYQTATCLSRAEWWRFEMPKAPSLIAATGFRGRRPKVVVNEVGALAVGSVCGIHDVPRHRRLAVVKAIQAWDLSNKIVPHSSGFRKVEINQFNTLLERLKREMATAQ